MADPKQGNSTASPPEGHAHIRLACQACQRKKIKCDRTFPCGQCLKSALDCVPSSRKQRARHAGKRAVDGELRNRIAKLESLVESLSGDGSVPDRSLDDSEVPTPQRTNSVDIDSPRVGKYVASTFWSSLSTEVAALREALEEDDDEEISGDTPDAQNSTPSKPDDGTSFELDLIITPPGRIYVMPGVMEDPPLHVKVQLNHFFLVNVEQMMKVFHTPSIKALLEDDAPYLGHQAGSPQHDALKRLAWFSALNSLTESEVLAVTGQAKGDLLPKYRRYVEILLAQSDFINTNDLATFQCFLMFTAVCRSTDSSRRTWTILAMLVRIAHAMHLNNDDIRATPYIREIKRRLWHYVRFLDKFCALDRGSIPLIRQEEHTTPLPTCTNDNLFGPESTTIPAISGKLCDMSFAVMCMEACGTIEALIVPESKTDMTWEQRYQLALDLGKKIESEYLVHCDLSDPWQRLQYSIGRSMSTAMLLRAVRPMQRHIASVPPPVNSPYVLQLAVDNLKEGELIFKQADLEAWRWMKWVPWHSLACALAGLCSIRGTELADKAWALVDPCFAWCSRYVADSQDGMLWRPIVKLYKKAQAFRDSDPARQVAPVVNNGDTVLHPEFAPADQMQFSSLDTARTGSVDHLSNNFSNLTPFAFMDGNQTSYMQQQPIMTAVPNDFDFNSSFTNGDWGDWGQLMDDYNNPLSMSDVSMDTASDWKWNPMPATGLNGLQ